AYDPGGMEQARSLLEDVSFAENAYDCASGADALVIVTEWDAFRALDFERLAKIMRQRVLVDLRNIYGAEEIERHGFSYFGVGRNHSGATPKLSIIGGNEMQSASAAGNLK
ncbi:MAG TPA: hypothetical protein ENJ26_01975, partial [Rhodobacteraceae bacterium]|nr:hypothetical protein [Paracoccaceae bacterium]